MTKRKALPLAPTTIIEQPIVEKQIVEPQIPKQELDLPIQTSGIEEVAAKEQKKAGFKKTTTKDGKDDSDESTSFMRAGYWIDEKVGELFVPLNERKKIFRKLYPKGAMAARIISNTYKSATAEARAFRDTADSQPFASDSGAANLNDMPYALKKKVPQVAASNAMWRTMNQAGIPMTLSEVFGLIDDEATENINQEIILETLDFKNSLLQQKWDEQLEFRKESVERKASLLKDEEWNDPDELIAELDANSNKILIGNGYIDEDELISSLKLEIIANENRSLVTKLLSLLKTFASLKEPEQKPQTKVKSKKSYNTKKLFIAKDKMTGHVVKEFKSRNEAAQWAGVAPNSISAAISPTARNRTAGGYFWTREEK